MIRFATLPSSNPFTHELSLRNFLEIELIARQCGVENYVDLFSAGVVRKSYLLSLR